MAGIRVFFRSWAVGLCAVVLVPAALLHGQERPEELSIDIRRMAKKADFIFRGIVIDVDFRNSEFVQVKDASGKPVYDPNGQPVWADGSNLAHSFVKCQIEHIYKGKAPRPPGGPPATDVTLQFVGGVCMDEPNDVVFVPEYPHMDLGDRDVLFVLGNTIRPCPLVGSPKGRFRVLVDPCDQVPKIYSEEGEEMLHVITEPPIPDQIDLGPVHSYPEVATYYFGDCSECGLERIIGEEANDLEEGEPEQGVPKGPQFTEAQFHSFVGRIVRETHTQEQLDAVPPVVSADVSQPFYAESYTEDEPNDLQPEVPIVHPRPWLAELPEDEIEAILEAERIENHLTQLSGGDPVLPSTPCEMRILMQGRMPGDISGPRGKPDCRVDFHEFVLMGDNWLQCSEPGEPGCI